MQRLFILLFLCTLVLLPVHAEETSDEYVCGNFTYALLPDGSAKLTGWSGHDLALILPEMVDGHVVTAIADHAFSGETFNRARYTSVRIPSTVTRIGDLAFAYSGLTQVELPLSVVEVGANPFLMCTNLDFTVSPAHPRLEVVDGALYDKAERRLITYSPHSTDSRRETYQIAQGTLIIGDYAMYAPASNDYQGYRFQQIIIPEGVTTIGDLALHGHNFLGMNPDGTPVHPLVIPDSVVHLGQNPFLNSVRSLDLDHIAYNLVIPEDHPTLKLVDGVLYDISENRLVGCYMPMLMKPQAFTVPDWVEHIDAYAFSKQTLNPIVLPEGLRSIGAYAFINCSVEEIVIPEGVTEVPEWAFSQSHLRKITLPQSLRSIGAYAFDYCTLNSIVIPEGVTSLGKYAFNSCQSLQSVSLPQSLKSIGAKAFADCRNLSEISLPPNLECIGEQAFFLCRSLQSLYLPPTVRSIGEGALFTRMEKTGRIIIYHPCELYALPGSWADTYCREQGYPVLPASFGYFD